MSAMVEHMRRRCQLVRDHGEPELANDVLAVAVNHHSSRETEEQSVRGTAPDPQLHTHVLWLLAERQDGRLCSIFRDGIWKDRYGPEFVRSPGEWCHNADLPRNRRCGVARIGVI